MNKKRTAQLMQLADNKLKSSNLLRKDQYGTFIEDAYNGQTAGFSVTIAMNGLLPALVIYYQQASESREINRKNILEVIGQMIEADSAFNRPGIKDADSLLKAAIARPTDKALKQEVIDCAIALKQIIRTYRLKEK